MKSHKIVPCPNCSREIELFFLRDIRVYYGGCLPCHNNIFALDDDVAWVNEYSEKYTHHWWIFSLNRRYWGTGLPKVPFVVHQVIKEPNTIVSLKLTDKIFTLYKKMYQGYQVPLDIDVMISEKDDED